MRWSAPAPARRRANSSARSSAPASSTTSEIEIEVSGQAPGQGGFFEIPGQPNVINIQDMIGKALGGKTAKRKVKVKDSHALLMADEADKLLDQDALDPRGDRARREPRHRLHRRDRQGRRRRARLFRPEPRRRAARPAAADRGHDGLDQIRAGQDRPHPLHRLGRVPCQQALGPAARAAGPPAHPRRAQGADQGGPRRHPQGHRRFADQAVCGADGDRGPDARLHGRRHRRDRRRRGQGQLDASKTSAPAGSRPSWSGSSRS